MDILLVDTFGNKRYVIYNPGKQYLNMIDVILTAISTYCLVFISESKFSKQDVKICGIN